jgi:protein-tyrosine phosphatase
LGYCIVFLSLAVGLLAVTFALWEVVGWVAIALGLGVVSFLLLAAAYAGVGPRLLLKRSNGSRALSGKIIFAPYFFLNRLLFALHRLLSREVAFVEVSPNLFLGRKLTRKESQSLKWISVLDLAVEFEADPVMGRSPGYRSLPILDGTAPTKTELISSNAWIAEAVVKGRVYVHCALGHGRSACVVIAYLLSTGVVPTIADGLRHLRVARPAVRLNAAQLSALRPFERRRE